jgi:hypothetical protein
MMGDSQNVPIVPIFVPTLFQNGCGIHSNRAQLRLLRLDDSKTPPISTKSPVSCAVI